MTQYELYHYGVKGMRWVYSFPLIDNVKSHNRVDTTTRINLADKNYKKAANDVRG